MRKKKIKLKDILPKNIDCIIEYRTHTPDGTDVLSGYCKWIKGNLVPMDGDDYSLEDEISNYEISQSVSLITVWYESKWIEG